jgi:hypothetical protein
MIDRTTEIERLSRLRELEKSRMLHDDYVNYPALKGAASCFIEPAQGSYSISTGVDYPVRAVPALQQIAIPVAWFSQRRYTTLWNMRRKTYRLKTDYGKGGSAFIPTLKSGVFPLRPLHPRKIKALRWAVEELTGKIAPTESATQQVGIVNVYDLINSLKLLDGKREIRFLDVANGDCDDDTSNIRGISLDEKGRYYIW